MQLSKNNKLLFNYKSNFTKEGYITSFKMKTIITPEFVQDIHFWNFSDPAKELSSLLREHMEIEVMQGVLRNMIKAKTNLKTIIVEKKECSNYKSIIFLKDLIYFIKKFNLYEYDLVVSSEILEHLKSSSNYTLAVDDEIESYSMGFEKVGYFNFYNLKLKKIKIYVNPYSPKDICLFVKNIRNNEFYITLNFEKVTYDTFTFCPQYKNHIAHINIPNDVKYLGIKVTV